MSGPTSDDGWPVLSLRDSSSYLQCMVGWPVLAKLAGVQVKQKSLTKFLLCQGFEPRQSSRLTITPLSNRTAQKYLVLSSQSFLFDNSSSNCSREVELCASSQVKT